MAVVGCGRAQDDAADGGAVPDAVGGRADAHPNPEGPGFLPHRSGFITLIEGSPFLTNGFGFEVVQAELRDGASVPRAARVAAHGDCAVYTHPAPGFCDPACGDQFCTAEATCVPYPSTVSAGDITVAGLRWPLTFTPGTLGYEHDARATPTDLFDDDALITATAAGADVPGLTLTARGVRAMVAPLEYRELEAGVAETVTWTAEGDGRVQVAFRRGWHGGPYTALLVCESDDSGAVTVPASMVDAYIDASGSGQVDYWWVARFTRDVAERSAGPIELFVANVAYHFQLD